VVLAWHVDYWDYLGWKDTFGSKEASKRQTRYASAHGTNRRWTPQFVVGNRVVPNKDVGRDLPALVDRGSKRAPKLAIEAGAKLAEGAIAVRIGLKRVDEDYEPTKTTGVRVALFARRATTRCERGENAGKTLEEFFAVAATRKLAFPGYEKSAHASLKPPKDVKPEDLGVAVLVEDEAKMKTVECTWVPVATK